MAEGYFLLGFAAAFSLVVALLLGVYHHLRHTRSKRANIQGYLDLIPDLSEEQRRRVQEIRRSFLPKVEKIRQDICRKRISLARALFVEGTDREAVLKVAGEVLDRQSELEIEVIDHILEEKEILDRKQQERFYEIILQQFSLGGLGVHDVKGRGKP